VWREEYLYRMAHLVNRYGVGTELCRDTQLFLGKRRFLWIIPKSRED